MNFATIEHTKQLMKQLHAGQIDHAGRPYYTHPLRVMGNLQALLPEPHQDVMMAALLHDIIEDCAIDAAYLLNLGYSRRCVDIVVLLTKPAGDIRSYAQVIDELAASGNVEAMLVKIADNMDNLHPQRAAQLRRSNPEKAQRLAARYRASIATLCGACGMDQDRVMALIASAG